MLATLAGWAVHSVAIIARALELGAPPLGNLPDAISVTVWVIVLVEVLIERRTGCACSAPSCCRSSSSWASRRPPPRAVALAPALASALDLVHIALALIGFAAFVFNFARRR